MKEIRLHIDQINRLCDTNKVRTLFVFGSAATDNLRNDSDIDFVVDIADNDPFSYTEKYFILKSQLEKLFKRQIDLLEEKAIKNPFLKENIDQTKVLIYGK
jgi:hypothetical protein